MALHGGGSLGLGHLELTLAAVTAVALGLLASRVSRAARRVPSSV